MKITALLSIVTFVYLFAAVQTADYYVKDIEPIPAVCPDPVCNIYCYSYSACSNYSMTCNQPGQKCSVYANDTTSALLFTLNCENGAECLMSCTGQSSCATTTFECSGQGTNCTHECQGLNSCSNNDFLCNPPSECKSSCSGLCKENPLVPSIFQNFYSALKLSLKDIGIHVLNRAITSTGDLQFLVEGYEHGTSQLISSLLREAAANFTDPALQNLTTYEVIERHPRVLEMDLSEDKFWGSSLKQYISRYVAPYNMEVRSANVSFSSQELNMTCVLSKPAFVPTSVIQAAANEMILEGVADSFGVPEERVTIIWSTPDILSSRIDLSIQTGCELPQPFYGTFCGTDRKWISIKNATLYLSDLISSPSSPLEHNGRFTVKNQLTIESPVAISNEFDIEGSSVSISGTTVSSNNSINILGGSLTITSSTVTTQESINLDNSILIMDPNQPIKAYGCLNINNNSTLTINSTKATYGVEYELISYACVTGKEKLNLKTTNGACYGTRWSALSLLVTFNPCANPPSGPSGPSGPGPITPNGPSGPGPITPNGPSGPGPITPNGPSGPGPITPNGPSGPGPITPATSEPSDPNGSEYDSSSSGGLPVYAIPIIVLLVVIVVIIIGAYVWITKIRKIKHIENYFNLKP